MIVDLLSHTLIAFPVYTDANEGGMAKGPGLLLTAWDLFAAAPGPAEIRALVPADSVHKYDNWIEIWATIEEAGPGPDAEPGLEDRVELTESGAQAADALPPVQVPAPGQVPESEAGETQEITAADVGSVEAVLGPEPPAADAGKKKTPGQHKK